MSEKTEEAPAADAEDKNKPMLLAGGAAALLIGLFAVISLVLLLLINSEVGQISEQVHKLAKTNKVLEDELKKVQEQLAATPSQSARTASAAPRPSHVDAGDKAQDCIIRPGSPNALANCLK